MNTQLEGSAMMAKLSMCRYLGVRRLSTNVSLEQSYENIV